MEASLTLYAMTLKDRLLRSGTESGNDEASILLLDGGVSTHLERLLRQQDVLPTEFEFSEIWSSSLLLHDRGQGLIQQGHRDWIEAGSDIISSVTYQCHFHEQTWPRDCEKLASVDDMHRLWITGLQLVLNAAAKCKPTPTRPIYTAASSGCFGAALANGAEYTGNYQCLEPDTMQALMDFHKRKIDTIVSQHHDTSVDCLAIETVPSFAECQALAKLFAENPNLLPDSMACWISLSCHNETEVNDGTLLNDALNVLLTEIPASIVQAIGLNCCHVQYLPKLVDTLVHAIYNDATQTSHSPTRAICLYPNSGEEWDSPNQTWKEGTGVVTPSVMAQNMMNLVQQIHKTWKKLNNQTHRKVLEPYILIGGCCRTTPETISSLRNLVDQYLSYK